MKPTAEEYHQQLLDAEKLEIAERMKALRNQMFRIEVEVLEGGRLPCKAHKNDAGFDLFATEDIFLYPGAVLKHPLNFKMKLPVGCWARIETKSGLGAKGMLVYAGVVDEGYRGVPHVIATNLNSGDFDLASPITIKKGEKIAQMTMNPHSNDFFVEQVKSIDTNTTRGDGGFGSTGKQ